MPFPQVLTAALLYLITGASSDGPFRFYSGLDLGKRVACLAWLKHHARRSAATFRCGEPEQRAPIRVLEPETLTSCRVRCDRDSAARIAVECITDVRHVRLERAGQAEEG